ncbi:MAG: tRNA preQ1(34) S-adenosylmethionine ribosyltransferase-isomerase QueA [Chlorobi bacterium]|nr:MAG: S-adenosylmethionine:trna-ribosyltransferase- isomerase [Chlorobi bacterium OLB6]MBE2265464.1 tRNA preQ1(34) S-adenosylmethionine ribosyltransferase-isomerase QueA [Flavobacteriales bacterium]MBL1160528.1 tRNA preQ1(34) S-adenosylmethionine ribosyltransferase-isomerase QueA [Chlorobiota bacterium]MBW7853223.1 tRNA preQ1(34) S-adenosylmethionine ribosyltransferase-isomerase QueA [Candidatus Kapabacteria bacterium]MCC6331288.1 tRNA preQ1(34) S-adenosylmethionine ribosyltransferase-isomera
MKLSEYKYSLPKNSVAKYPVEPRDSSRLMIINRETGDIEEKHFRDILNYMQKGDVIVVNEAKVFPARLFGNKEKTNAKIEVMLLRELKKQERIWDVLVEPARKVRIGNKIYFDDNKIYCEIIDNTTSRGRTVRFSYDGDLHEVIERIGQMPLPDYFKRDAEELDKEAYQCVFANPEKVGSIAPSAAGLHFTPKLLKAAEKKGIKIATVRLNLGQGVFETIEVEDLTKHRMYSEYFEISKDNADIINKALKSKRFVYAVGSSVARALESSVLTSGIVKPNKGWTDRFIYPPYEFKIANRFITNFHQPASPGLLLASAFLGDREALFKAYRRAIRSGFRFHAYGDAMLII